MTIKSKRHVKGIITKPTTAPAAEEGEQRTDSSSNEQKVYLGGEERTVITNNQTQTLTNKTIGDTNTIEAQDDAFSIHNAADDTKTLEFDIVYNDPNVKTTLRTLSDQTADKVFVFPKVPSNVDVDELLSEYSDSVLRNKYMLSSCTYEILENKLTIFDQASSTRSLKFAIESDANSETTLAANSTGDRTLTLPDATDTLVGKETEDTLKNKTIDATAATGTNTLSADAVDIIYNNTDSPRLTDINVKAALDSTDANLTTITGIGPSDLDLGAFNGTTISDNVNIRTALQELEDAHENHKDNPTGVHNVVGDVVGTKGNQTLQQKVLDQSNLITGTYLSEAGVSTIRIKNENENSTSSLYFNCTQTTSGRSTTLETGNIPFEVGDITITLPNNTTTLVGTDTPQQLSNKVLKDELTFTEIGTPVPTPDINKVVLYPKADGKFYKKSSDGKEEELGAGGGGATSFEINQLAHGFAVGEGIYHDAEAVGGAKFDKAQADNANTLAYYVVTEVIDNDTFVASDFGRIQVTKPSHGYNAGDFHFLSTDILTSPTVTSEPTSGFSNPLFYVEEVVDPNTVILQVKVYRPAAVGQTIALNDISDVDTTGLVSGNVLGYNGDNWVPVAPAAGGATQLDDLSDVTIAATPNNGDILEYNGTAFVPAAPSGGAGITILNGGDTMSGSYHGDVLCNSGAAISIGANTTIRGSLIFDGPANLDSNSIGYSLTVLGNVYSSGGLIDLSSNTASIDGGNFICKGSVYNVSINTYGGGATSSQPGQSGIVDIQGDYIAPLSNIFTHGGASTIAGVSPSSGGSVTIKGNAEFSHIWTYGGNSRLACDQIAGNGGDITIGGNASSNSTTFMSFTSNYTAINFSGGNSEDDVATIAGAAGKLTIGGNAYFAGGFTGKGGDCTSVAGLGNSGGTGGGFEIGGNLTVLNNINISGGDGTSEGGDGTVAFDNVIVRGTCKVANQFNANGGAGSTGNGGNAPSYISFFGPVYINILNIQGGDADTGFTNGGSCAGIIFKEGGNIGVLNMFEGSGGNDSTIGSLVILENGHYSINQINRESKAANEQVVRGTHCTLNVKRLLGEYNFTNGSGTPTANQTNPEQYTYRFGDSSDLVRRSAQYITI